MAWNKWVNSTETITYNRRYSAHGAKTYDELFSGNLYSYRKSIEQHVCGGMQNYRELKVEKGCLCKLLRKSTEVLQKAEAAYRHFGLCNVGRARVEHYKS